MEKLEFKRVARVRVRRTSGNRLNCCVGERACFVPNARLKRIPRLGRLRLREPHLAQFEFTLAAIAQNLRRLR